MGRAAKVYRSMAKELGLLTQAQFFNSVAAAAGYTDPEYIKRVYNAILNVLYRELREKGAVRFPALCDFHLTLTKPRRTKNHNMPVAITVPPHHQVRIRPIYSVKKYFKELDKRSPGVLLDPGVRAVREKLTYRNHSRRKGAKAQEDTVIN